ncbi:MAG TPA: RNA polymerase sigma factor [Myxococcales bacterium]|nr:RNA polymerase sigma factor [Myxococcales bacterium]
MPSAPHAATADDEEEIIARCREGDRGAFRALYSLHFARVHQTARRLGTPPSELDDVTQEVFASAFGKLDRFEGGRFAHWLHRICANVVTDHHRKRNVREAFRRLFGSAPAEAEAPEPSPEGAAERAQASAQVSAILARMRPKQREVFALFELEGLSGDEIAARVGCPVNTVWTRLHHARQAFVTIGRKRGYILAEGER